MAKDKGKILEMVVAEIEQLLSDYPDTTITQRAFIIDTEGCRCEIDILVEVTINRKKLKYAFECKNWKHPVKKADIVVFQDKIKNQGIKGCFVTTGKYQQGAIKKANAWNIDLYNILTAQQPKFEKFIAFHNWYKIAGYIFHLDEEPKSDKVDEANLYYGPEKIKVPTPKLAESIIQPQVEQYIKMHRSAIFRDFWSVDGEEVDIQTLQPKVFDFHGSLTNVYIKCEEEYLPINEITAKVIFQIDSSESGKADWHLLQEKDKQSPLAGFSLVPFNVNDEDSILQITRLDGEDKYRYTLTVGSGNDSQRMEFEDLGTLPSDMKIRITKPKSKAKQ